MGKTATTRHIALELKADNYDVVPSKSPADVVKYSTANRKSLFIFDDICGKSHVRQQKVEEWERYSEDIERILSVHDIKILSNCRLQIFQSKSFQSLKILQLCHFNMTSKDSLITIQEKRRLATVYLTEESLSQLTDDDIQRYDSFPLLCTIVSLYKPAKALQFFRNPFTIFENELEKMILSDTNCFLVLALVVVFENKLDLGEPVFESIRQTINNVSDACGEIRGISTLAIKQTSDTLLNSYLQKEKGIYKFINEHMFETVFNFMAKNMMHCVLNNCSITRLCEKIGLQGMSDESVVILSSEQEHLFFKRLVMEINEENFLDIFGSQRMTNDIYRNKFLRYLKDTCDTTISKLLLLSRFGVDILHLMCKLGYSDFVKFCIEHNAGINKYDDLGLTPLHKACRYEKKDVIDLLLQNAAHSELCSCRGFTPIYEACMSGNTAIVKTLLQNGSSPNVCSKRRLIPLLAACKNGFNDIVKLLLDYGANINIQNSEGLTGLHIACSSNGNKIVELLLHSKYIDIDILSSEGKTSLHIACDRGNVDIIRMLMTKGANILCRSKNNGLSGIGFLIKNGKKDIAFRILKDLSLNCSLSQFFKDVCENEDEFAVKLLLDFPTEININQYITSGKTVLHMSCTHTRTSVLTKLIVKGADVNKYTKTGDSALQIACINICSSAVKMLIESGAIVNQTGTNSKLPLPVHIACLLNETDLVNILANSGGNVNECAELTLEAIRYMRLRNEHYIDSQLLKSGNWNKLLITPIEIASFEQNMDVLKILLENGADANVAFQTGVSPLHIACFYNKIEMVNLLVKHKIKTNLVASIDDVCLAYLFRDDDLDLDTTDIIQYVRHSRTKTSITPLHIACCGNRNEIMKVLLSKRANINTRVNINALTVAILHDSSPLDPVYFCHDIIDTCSEHLTIDNVRPLHLACFTGNIEFVKWFVRKAVNKAKIINSTIKLQLQVMFMRGNLSFCDSSKLTRYFRFTPVQIACLRKNWKIVEILTLHGANTFDLFDIPDKMKSTFLDKTCNKNIVLKNNETKLYKVSVIKLLFEANKYDTLSVILDITEITDSTFFDLNNLRHSFAMACCTNDVVSVKFLHPLFHNEKFQFVKKNQDFT